MNDRLRRGPDTHHAAPHELSCEESLALVYEYLDGELRADWNEVVRGHVEKCRRCYPHFDFERLFLDYVHEAGGEEHPDPELEARIRELIDSSAGG